MILHGIIFGLVMFGGVLVSPTRGVQWGEAGARGGAVPVSLIPSVPLLSTMGPENPLASPTKEMNPAEPKPPARQQPKQPSAKEFQQAEREANRKLADLERRQLERELAAVRSREVAGNAIPGTTASGRAASPIYGMSTGQGAGGIGFAGEFGTVYGWYVRQVRECISRHWDQSRVDAVVRSAPRVYLEFDIERDGTIRGERIATSSSIPSIDREALRSVQACSGRRDVGADAHLPALPGDYRGSSVHVEVWFEFQK
jgi:outer membrane biosynthesis protein TonB